MAIRQATKEFLAYLQEMEDIITHFFGLPRIRIKAHADSTKHSWTGMTHKHENTIGLIFAPGSYGTDADNIWMIRELLTHETLHYTGIAHTPATRTLGFRSMWREGDPVHQEYDRNIAQKIFGYGVSTEDHAKYVRIRARGFESW